MNVSHLFFDFDGTLADSLFGLLNGFRHMFRKLHVKIPSDAVLKTYVGPPIRALVAEQIGEDDATMEAAHKYFREYNMSMGIFESELFAGIPELLETLKEKGKHLYIATGKQTYQADVAALNFGITQLFDGIHGFEPHNGIHNKAQLLENCIRIYGFHPNDAVMIGDRAVDILAGQQAGIKTIGVLYGYGEREEIQSAHPDEIANDVADLKRILLGE